MKEDNESPKSSQPAQNHSANTAQPAATQQTSAASSSKSSTSSNTTREKSSKQSAGRNILSADVEITGKINFTNDLVVDGKIDGEITSNGSLTVGENARIKAVIKTRSVVIYGKVHGNITVTGGVELKKDAELVGDIVAGTLSIEAGAIFLGKSTVGAPSQASKPAASPVAKPAASPAAKPAPTTK